MSFCRTGFYRPAVIASGLVILVGTLSLKGQDAADGMGPALSGHDFTVSSADYSPDGKLVATGSFDRSVRIWDAADASPLRTLSGHTGQVRALELSPDATLVATGSESGLVKFWLLADGADRMGLAGHDGPVRDLAFHPEGQQVVTAGEDGTARLWDLPVSPMPLAGHSMPVTTVDVSDDGKLLATGAADKTVRLFNSEDGSPGQTIEGHAAALSRLAFRPDSGELASGDEGGVVRLSNPADGTALGEVTAHTGAVTGLAYLNPTTLLTTGSDGTLKWWQLPQVAPVQFGGHTMGVRAVDLSDDAALAVIGGADGVVQLIDPTGQTDAQALTEHPGPVNAVALSADKVIRQWDPAAKPDEETQKIEPVREITGHAGAVTSLALSGQTLVSGSADNAARIFTVSLTNVLSGHEGAVTSLAYLPDAAKIVSGGADKHLRAFAPADALLLEDVTLAAQRVVVAHEDAATTGLAVLKTADAFQLVTGGDDNLVRLWSPDGEPVADLSGAADAVLCVTTSSDGTQIAAATADAKLLTWTANGEAGLNADVASPIHSLMFDATGQFLAAGCADNHVRLLSPEDGRVLERIGPIGPAPADNAAAVPVSAVSVAPDGRSILANGNGNAASVVRRSLLAKIDAHTGGANAVTFTADGSSLVTGGADKLARLWTIPADASIEPEEVRINAFAGPADAVTGVDVVDDAQAGPVLAASSTDGSVHSWPLTTAPAEAPVAATSSFTHGSPVRSVSLAADGKRIAAVADDGFVRVWDVASGRELQRFTGHEGAVYQLDFNSDGTQLASGGLDGTVRVWNASNGTATRTLAPEAPEDSEATPSPVFSVAFSPDGQSIATGTRDHSIRIWNVGNGALSQTLTGHESAVYRVNFNAAGSRLLSCDHSGEVRIWNLANGQPLFEVTAPAVAWSATYAPAGEEVLVTCSDSKAYFVPLPNGAKN